MAGIGGKGCREMGSVQEEDGPIARFEMPLGYFGEFCSHDGLVEIEKIEFGSFGAEDALIEQECQTDGFGVGIHSFEVDWQELDEPVRPYIGHNVGGIARYP